MWHQFSSVLLGYGACEYLVPVEKTEGPKVALREMWNFILGRPVELRPLKEYSPMLDEVEGDA